MTEDFYNIPPPQPVQPLPSTPKTPRISSPISQPNSNNIFLFDFSTVLSLLNTFALAWTIFYSILCVCQFFYYYVKYNENSVGNIKKGKKYLFNAFKLWYSYLLTLGFFVLYLGLKTTFFGLFVGVIACLTYFLKFLAIDLAFIPVFDSVAKNVQKVLALPFDVANTAITNSLAPKKEEKKDDKKGKK
jgi:hypothetical protein